MRCGAARSAQPSPSPLAPAAFGRWLGGRSGGFGAATSGGWPRWTTEIEWEHQRVMNRSI